MYDGKHPINSPFKVLIIGAGRISAFFDSPGSAEVLTHAHAVSLHPGFQLAGFVDTDQKAAEEAASLWQSKAFQSVDEAFQAGPIDIAAVAAADEAHFPLLLDLADRPLQLVFAEKPLTKTVAESEQIERLYRAKKKALAVNYSRRYVSEFVEIGGNIRAGKWGRLLAGQALYGKGFVHNGSHWMNLFLHWFGDVTGCQVLGQIEDCYEDDPSLRLAVTFDGDQTILFNPVDCRQYTVFEADLCFENHRLRIADAGFSLESYQVHEDARFAGYRKLLPGKPVLTGLGTAMASAYDNLYAYLTGAAAIQCDLADAVRTMKQCAAVGERAR
ncbi:MAG: Gfo/Idh/MocA family protein [Solirubrobacterales bacterium]